MPPDNVELVRRCYEVINAIGRTTGDFVDPEEIAPDLWARLDVALGRGHARQP